MPIWSSTTKNATWRRWVYEQLQGGGGVPVGSVVAYSAASPWPEGWAICDGSSQLRTGEWADLFDVIGVTYGNVDGTHFNLPDYRGEFLRGRANGSTNDPDRASRTDRGEGTSCDNVGTK